MAWTQVRLKMEFKEEDSFITVKGMRAVTGPVAMGNTTSLSEVV